MANYETLKAAIQSVVKTNGNNEITGALLQQSLLAMINSLGNGYQYIGIAKTTTKPGTPDQNVFYIASEIGTYPNFDGLAVSDGEVAILKYNGSWTKEITGAATKDYVEAIGKVIELFGIATHWNMVSTTGWQVGYKMYNTAEKRIKTCGSVSESGGVVSWSDQSTPRTDCVYICGGRLYVWNGNDLIDVTFIAETGADFAEAVAKKFVGGVLTPVSVEDGYLDVSGNLKPSAEWKTRKYDIRDQRVVFISGSDTNFSALCAQYDENDKVLSVFNPIPAGSSENFVNVLIPVFNATYLKVSGRPDSVDSSCRIVFQGDVAQKQYVDEELEKRITKDELPNISIQKTIDIEQGSLNNIGKFASLQRIRSVDFIASDGQLVLNCNNGFGYRVYEYSSDSFNDFIRNNLYDNGGLNTFTPQSNTTYIRFVFLKTNGNDITVSEFGDICFTINGVKQYSEDWDIASKQYVDSQFAEKILQGKTVVFLGDSITAGGQGSGDEQVTAQKVYHKIFANLTGCTNVNLGSSGTCIANNTLNDLGPNRFVTRATQQNLQNADYIVVWGGTNDFSYDCKAIGDLFIEETITPDTYVGSKRKEPTTDTDSFAGALHDLIATIRSHNATAPILFMTPLNRIRYASGRPSSRETNQWGDWLDDFRDAIKKICAYYGIPVFDIGICSELDPQNSGIYSAYFADGIHPNASGHKIIGTLLYHWFKANMNY